MLSLNKGHFTSFTIEYLFIPYLIALAKIFHTILDRSEHLCLVTDLRGKHLVFHN